MFYFWKIWSISLNANKKKECSDLFLNDQAVKITITDSYNRGFIY